MTGKGLADSPAGRRILFAALYLSEGAPIGWVWWALPARLRLREVPIADITALAALLALPWALKFLWAPLVDVVRPRRLGFRVWIVGAQLVMGATLLPLVWLDLRDDFALVRMLLLAHALAAATQDVAIDGLAVAVTPPGERGAVNGVMQAGMLLGRSAFGAGTLGLGAALGDATIILALVATIWSTSLLALVAREPARAAAPRQRTDGAPRGATAAGFLTGLRAALARRATWLGLAIALTGGAAFEAAGALAGPLLVDRGFAAAAVGDVYLAGVAAMLAGALVGGRAADRWGRRRTVGAFLGLLAALVTALGAADAAAGDGVMAGLVVAVYLGIGLFTAASYALFMDLTDPRLGATQFSAYMGATNACESWAAFAVGRLAAAQGSAIALAILSALSLVAVGPLGMLGSGGSVRARGGAGGTDDG